MNHIILMLPSFSDFAQEFTSEVSVLFGNSIRPLCVLAAAAKASSDLFKYVTGHGFIGLNCALTLKKPIPEPYC